VNFTILPAELRAIAEKAAAFFEKDRGVSKFREEEEVSHDLPYRPTLQAVTPEHQDLWIEVSETPYLTSLDGVVLHCVRNGLPVKLYVAFPAGRPAGEYKRCVDEARKNGVGAIEVSDKAVNVIHEAMVLSLLGARFGERSKFPLKIRSALSTAESTFKNGDPAKGCAHVYDEIEQISRKLAKKIKTNNWWTHLRNTPAPSFNAEKGPWATVLDILLERTDFNRLPKAVNRNLLLRVAALTEQRNETGHKPKTRAALARRDAELRTRVETAVDLLRDLLSATAPLRL
jgi:hypothetical protein